ncbi:hypothetical protein QTH42_14970 [Clostridium perfringens]|nr:hypothetical protein [Clostridium perfringens]
MNKILVDIREDVQATTEIKTVGASYKIVIKAPESFGVVKLNLNFNQLDNAIDEMRRYNCEPTFEELENDLDAAKEEIKELENDLDAAKEEIKELENDFNSLRERYRK